MAADRPDDGPPPPSDALSPWLEVRAGTHYGVLEVSVLGEIDLTNHHQLRGLLGALDPSGSARVDLDLSQLAFSDTRGVCHLLDFAERAQNDGVEVRIVSPQPTVARVLGVLTGLADTA